MLVLEIEWLRGVAVLARNPADPAPDWPPHPDRIFSALVASWGARGEAADERVALEWLERQPPPLLEACPHRPRDTVTVYVPVNDAEAPTGTEEPGWLRKYIAGAELKAPDKKARASHLGAALIEARSRQPRTFPTTRLAATGVHLRVTWANAPDDVTLAALEALARDTSYVGHSSSLVRCRFTRTEAGPVRPGQWSELPRPRAPYEGRLAELKRLHERHVGGDERARAKLSSLSRSVAEQPHAHSHSIFSPDWIVLSHVGGERPDPLATAVIAKAMRNALMSVWPEQPPPSWLSGHEPEGVPARDPHLAVLPLADVGYDWSDGHLMGLALVPPRALAEQWKMPTPAAWEHRRALPRALESLGNEVDGTIRLCLGRAGTWDIAVDEGRVALGLRPQRYCRPAHRFATMTPIALDRHPKGDHIERSEEARRLVALACTRIGLPEPTAIALSKHAAARGASSAQPPGGAPAWATWARPRALAGKALVHAVIEFAGPVEGPVVLGAGRFLGLGLCLPVGEAP